MDVSFDDGLDWFRDEVRAFLAENWTSDLAKVARDAKNPGIQQFRKKAISAGYLYRHVPAEFGGSEQPVDVLKSEVIRDEFSRARAAGEFPGATPHFLLTLLQWGTEWQKEQFIRPTLVGEMLWCQGYSEPNAGSDLASLRTKAELIDNEWHVNGQKLWTSGAERADFIYVLARTEPDAPKREGISYLIVDMHQPGITVNPLKPITGPAEFCEVFFDDARTPADWIVGERGKGWTVSRTTLRHERASVRGLNYQEARFRNLVSLAKQVDRGGRPAIEDPVVRQQLAELEGFLASIRYSAHRQFSMELAEQDPGIFPLLRKLYSANMATKLSMIARDLIDDEFLLLNAGAGAGTSKWVHTYITTLIMSIAGGASNIQRNIIAERGLGLPRDRNVT